MCMLMCVTPHSTVEQQLDDILDEYGQYLDDFKGSVLPDVIEARDDVVAMATQYWSSAYKVCMQHW